MKIAILGAGAFGTALGGILIEKGHDVAYYDPRLEGVTLESVLEGADYILLCVPSSVVAQTVSKLPKDLPLIAATKGILSDKVFGDFDDYMILSGPGFAADIKAHKQIILTTTDDRVVELFGTEYLTFDRTTDKRGVLMCGALKNVYAILAGLLELKPGTIQHEKYLTEVAEEMQALLSANGADSATVDLACGVGDLRLTCGKPSRNYEFGRKIRRNPKYTPDNTVEGLATLRRIKRGEIKVPDNAVKLKDLIKRSETWS